MSYDIELFQLADGVTTQQINAFLDSDEYQEYLDAQDAGEREEKDCDCEDDEDEDEAPSIPARFINTKLDEEVLQHIIFRAWLRGTTREESRSAAVREYLASDEDEVPDELDDDFTNMFEYSGTPGVQPLMFGYGGNLCQTLEEVARTLENLRPQRIAAFDPQLDKIVDGDNARALLIQSGQESQATFDRIVQQLTGGGFVTEGIAEGSDEDEG